MFWDGNTDEVKLQPNTVCPSLTFSHAAAFHPLPVSYKVIASDAGETAGVKHVASKAPPPPRQHPHSRETWVCIPGQEETCLATMVGVD